MKRMRATHWLVGLGAGMVVLAVAAGAWAADFTNHLGMQFNDVPAGSFWMGSCRLTQAQKEENERRRFIGLPPVSVSCAPGTVADPDAYDDETPQHQVRISAFQIGVHEVTLGQFKPFLATRTDLVTADFMKVNNRGDDAPVVHVSWHDANAFIDWLNRTKPARDRGRYRLPSESEWEYACRSGGKAERYCGGSDVNALAWHDGNSGGRQHPVGRKRPNGLGLHDMSGNVWEWVQNCWNYSYNGAPNNGNSWTSGQCEYRVLRGGSWFDSPRVVGSADRYRSSTDDRSNYNLGFRVARTF